MLVELKLHDTGGRWFVRPDWVSSVREAKRDTSWVSIGASDDMTYQVDGSVTEIAAKINAAEAARQDANR